MPTPAMLKNIVAAAIITFLTSFTYKQDYGPLQLDWTIHYQGVPDPNSKFYALTALVFNYTYESSIRQNTLNLKFNFKADVNKANSWVKLNKIRGREAKASLLRHEQGHVNINYLLMRETERKLRTRRYSIKTYKKEIEDTAAKVYQYYDKMQLKYDEETNHGTNDEAQAKWELFINKSIMDLQ